MIFELRRYQALPGQRENVVRIMEDTIIPYQISKGVVVVGSFVSMDEDDIYIWIRRFDNDEELERICRDVYESDTWLNVMKPEIDKMLNRETIQVTRMTPTPKSVIR